MGEIADMVLVGVICESCCGFIDGQVVGYPRQCEDCKEE